MLKPFTGEKILSLIDMRPKMMFFGKMGVKTLDIGFATPKGSSLRGTTSFDVFCVKIGARVSAVASVKNQKVAESLCAEGREITHAQNQNP